jgi:adenylate cyclase
VTQSRWSARRPVLLVIVALVAALCGMAAYAGNLLRQPELATIDARFTIRGPEKPPPDVVLVAIDAKTFNDLNVRWPFPRRLHARVLDRLRAAGARAIGYDVQFTEQTDPADDNALVDAAARAPHLVLATTEVARNGSTHIFGGDAVLRQIGARPANTSFAPDADGAIRRLPWSIDGLRTFGVVLAEAATGKAVPRSSFPKNGAPIDFTGPPSHVRSISFSDVLARRFPPGLFRGKVAIVGPTAPSLQDVHATSASRSDLMPGAEINANAFETVRRDLPLSTSPRGVNVLLILLLACAAPLASLRLSSLRAALVGAGLGLAYAVGAQLAFGAGLIVPFTYPILALALSLLGTLAVNYVIEAFERERVRQTFARFVPEAVVDDALAATGDGLRLGGVRRQCTVLFSDVRSFTTFSETREPDEVIEVLNRYLGEMTDAIMANGGTLISYIGDGIMALFGAPIEQDDHADRAIAAAREMVGPRLDRVNAWLAERGLEPFAIGIGINSGPVMAGNVGSEQRLEYTAIGDTCNTASRLEGMTKGTGRTVFIASATRAMLKRAANDLEFVGDLPVRGRTQRLAVWTITGSPRRTPPAEADGAPAAASTSAPAAGSGRW